MKKHKRVTRKNVRPLKDSTSVPKGVPKPSELWTLKQLSEYLQLPDSTTYMLVAQGKIPVVKLGKHRRFIPEEVEKALRKMPL